MQNVNLKAHRYIRKELMRDILNRSDFITHKMDVMAKKIVCEGQEN
jgi:hypothetical protein